MVVLSILFLIHLFWLFWIIDNPSIGGSKYGSKMRKIEQDIDDN